MEIIKHLHQRTSRLKHTAPIPLAAVRDHEVHGLQAGAVLWAAVPASALASAQDRTQGGRETEGRQIEKNVVWPLEDEQYDHYDHKDHQMVLVCYLAQPLLLMLSIINALQGAFGDIDCQSCGFWITNSGSIPGAP